jgi:predicted enzyme related to lactoylglutathione lyase
MSEVTFTPGNFCWIELATSDGTAAKGFYTDLLGWTADDSPMGDGQVYTMLRKGDKRVGALYTDNRGIPPNWMSYIAVTSADDAAARARELGGVVVAEPFDVMEHGRMAVIQDPQSATFAVWEARNHKGIELYGETGSLCWNELATRNAESAASFYSALFGWTTKESTGSGMQYTEFHNGEKAIGGMYTITPEMGEMPPNWMPYFAVSDCDGTAAKAIANGGRLMVPPTDIPTVGRFAGIIDPQVAFFAVVKLLDR